VRKDNPGGLLKFEKQDGKWNITAQNMDYSKYADSLLRIPDFSALHYDARGLYVLERNLFSIAKIKTENGKFLIVERWDYTEIERKREFFYSKMQFGKAEGMAMDKDNIYLILDNNGLARQNNPNDRRPLLLVLKRPP